MADELGCEVDIYGLILHRQCDKGDTPVTDAVKMYEGTKKVYAKPMTRAEYNEFRGWVLPADEDGSDKGYLVEYVDGGKPNHPAHAGYISWSPDYVFKAAYKEIPIGPVVHEPVTEQELVAKATGPRVTKEELEANIADKAFYYHGLLTICVITLRNGFTVVGESACAWPANYDKDIGERLSFSDAQGKIWPLMGYHLKQQLFENREPTQLQSPQEPDSWMLAQCEESTDSADATTEASAASGGTWQERLRTEYDELSDRLKKLEDFISHNPLFKSLSDRQQRLQIDQREAMQTLFSILEARLHDHGLLLDQ